MAFPRFPLPDGLRLTVHSGPGEVEPFWRALEAAGVHTPYQRCDFVQAWLSSFGLRPRHSFAAFLVRDGGGAPLALLPVEVEKVGPARIARFCGGKHANFGMPLIDRRFARVLAPDAAAALIQAMGETHGEIDLFALVNQPLGCDGVPNPFALGPSARPSPEPANRASFVSLGAETADHVVSKASRKKLAAKARRLGERGPVRFWQAGSAEEVGSVLDVFFRQKAARSAALSLPNPFSDFQAQRFLKAAATSGRTGSMPALELHALSCGEEIVAVFGAATNGRWLSGCIISHAAEPLIERCSPGELLLLEVLRDAGRRGFESFDLGVGGGAYKASFCKEEIALADTFTPVTMLGRAVAPLLAGADALKAAIKRDARLLRAAQRLAPLLRTG